MTSRRVVENTTVLCQNGTYHYDNCEWDDQGHREYSRLADKTVICEAVVDTENQRIIYDSRQVDKQLRATSCFNNQAPNGNRLYCCQIESFQNHDYHPKWCSLSSTNSSTKLFITPPDVDLSEDSCHYSRIYWFIFAAVMVTGLLWVLCYYAYRNFIISHFKMRDFFFSRNRRDENVEFGSPKTPNDDDPLLAPAVQVIKITSRKLCGDIIYCQNEQNQPVVLGEGRYGYVYKAMYEEQTVAVKCIEREEKAEHEKIMFELIGARSDYLLRALPSDFRNFIQTLAF